MSSPSITRRGLLRGVGTATVLGSCAKPTGRDPTPPGTVTDAEAPAEIGPDAVSLTFTLNGKSVIAQVEPRVTLLTALRDELHTTGPKLVCDRGACGACTVLVDGMPRNACMMLAHDVAGANVTTVEGLGDGESLSALQSAFVRHDALQCGFCTSGMLTSCAALLRRHNARGGKLDAARVREAIAGNLCRCGTYPHVVAAVLEVANGGAAAKGGA
jgi:xanthine dehydrogenase YagT iron-sulfur-binding subunit